VKRKHAKMRKAFNKNLKLNSVNTWQGQHQQQQQQPRLMGDNADN